jgi:plasmid stabilization system protein ParE
VKRRLRWHVRAIDDLAKHAEYVSRDSHRAAHRIAERIREVTEDLAIFAVGRPGRLSGTFERVLVDIPYTITYAVRAEHGVEVISILRVMHQAQQWPPLADD